MAIEPSLLSQLRSTASVAAMRNGRATAFLGFDACDPVLVQRWARDGLLPNFSQLLGRAACAPVLLDPRYYVASLWTSFATGRDPLTNGYVCWAAIEPGTYRDVPLAVGPHLGTPLWEVLSANGRSVSVIDVPHSWLPSALDGSMVVDRCSHDRRGLARSLPASLCEELDDRVGVPRHASSSSEVVGPCDVVHRVGPLRSSDEQVELHRDLVADREVAAGSVVELLERDRPDFFCAVLADTHCVGHQLWHLHDPGHHRHDRLLRDVLGDPVLASYRQADRTLGEVLLRLDQDAALFVLLSHGMGASHDGSALLEPLLARLAASWRGDARRRHPLARAADAMSTTTQRAHLTGRAVSHVLRRTAVSSTEHARIERSNEPWFALPGAQSLGAVRLNLVDREPSGSIAAGSDASRALSFLRTSLLELVNVDTGRPAIEHVEIEPPDAPGPFRERLADLVLHWRHDGLLQRVWSPRVGLVATSPGHWRSGDHRDRGLLMVSGPGVRGGARPALRIPDITASLLASQGCEPAGVDGRARADLLPAGSRQSGPSRVG